MTDAEAKRESDTRHTEWAHRDAVEFRTSVLRGLREAEARLDALAADRAGWVTRLQVKEARDNLTNRLAFAAHYGLHPGAEI
jgi:hypothetical protein